MSEFKFACPVCGQHMMCDVSQGGSVMECPTCFQQIVAPQAPGPDVKFILTGTKLSEKKITARVDGPVVISAEKKFPWLLVVALIAFCGFTVAAVVFRDKIFPAKPSATPTNELVATRPPPKPMLVAPPASDTNWSLTLDTNAIPDSPVAGRIHGQNFIIERATFREGSLMLRAGTKGPVDFGAQISFGGAPPESLAGQTFNILADTNKSARVTLRWKDNDGPVQKESYDDSYAMRLEFGPLANNHLPGKIWLCTPDAEKSYLLGSFNADARKHKPKAPKK